MKVVLLDGRPRPSAPALQEQASALTRVRPGTVVSALAWGPPGEPAAGTAEHCGQRGAGDLDQVVVLRPDAPVQHARGSTVTRLRRAALRLLTGGGTAARFARAARRNPQARALLGQADLVVALDTTTIRPAWHVARRRPSAQVVYGLASAERVLRSSRPSGRADLKSS